MSVLSSLTVVGLRVSVSSHDGALCHEVGHHGHPLSWTQRVAFTTVGACGTSGRS